MLHEIFAELREKDLVFWQAREAANAAGKPLLNAGCGIWYQTAILNSDVNMDYKRRNVPNFVLSSLEDMSMFGDKQFGAVFCSHVLEHVKDLGKARAELDRVADYEFIITPSPLFITNWLSPWHRRVFNDTRGQQVLLELPPKPWLRDRIQ